MFTDFRQMVTEGSINAVNDFTTHALHHQVANAALGAGKHLLTQKPLAVSVAAGLGMCRQAEDRDLVLGVFENARNLPETRYLGWLFRTGGCGNLQMVYLANIGQWWAPNRIVAETPWRHQIVEGGGITLDIGVHLFNQFRYVAGEVESVTGHTTVLEPVRTTQDGSSRVVQSVDCDADDTMIATFQTEHGVLGHLTASWARRGNRYRRRPGCCVLRFNGRCCRWRSPHRQSTNTAAC